LFFEGQNLNLDTSLTTLPYLSSLPVMTSFDCVCVSSISDKAGSRDTDPTFKLMRSQKQSL